MSSSSSSGMRSPRSPHAAFRTHVKKPSFPGLPGRPSIHSLSAPMGWLSRTSSSNSINKTHKPSRSIELLSSSRSGTLGSGATIVRTPDEALKDSGIRLPLVEEKPEIDRTLPPLPSELESDDEGERIEDYPPESDSEEDVHLSSPIYPRPACPVPLAHSSLCMQPDVMEVPPPQFRVLLMSATPDSTVDRSKVIVTLETGTTTHRTTLDTLLSQPSFLSEYLLSLFPRARRGSQGSSVYSGRSEGDSEIRETYRKHLISQGLLSQAPFSLHLFLDRPSEAYSHILHYLRCGAFPRVSGLDSLLDLRDEAAFLGLSALYNICSEQVNRQPSGRAPHVASMHGSIHSLHAAVERFSSDSQVDHNPDRHYPSEPRSRPSHTKAASSDSVGGFKPPTPQSWKDGRSSHGRSTSSLRAPAAGWI